MTENCLFAVTNVIFGILLCNQAR